MAFRDSLARAWANACSDTSWTNWACWRKWAKMGEEGAQFGLNAHPHASEHDGDQRRQRQLATARECGRMVGVAGVDEKFC